MKHPPPGLAEWIDDPERLGEFAQLLATDGVAHGLIGPNEVARIWERHLLNCAVVASRLGGVVPQGARVIDIGSGAGLPGLAWALTRRDLDVVLVEAKERRCAFLSRATDSLGLAERVTVCRGRAEDLAGLDPGDVVTARAVAPLPRLIGWAMPLVAPGGRLVALKGGNAEAELCSARDLLARNRLVARVARVGGDLVAEPTRLVIVERKDV